MERKLSPSLGAFEGGQTGLNQGETIVDILPGIILIPGLVVAGGTFTAYALLSDRRKG